MIAEIKHKIASDNRNLSETSEDELTGNFFGNIRYLPFHKGLKPILLNAIYPTNLKSYIENINEEFLGDRIEFWPYDYEGELDVYMEFESISIGVEVKFTSPLSSDDDIDNSKVLLDDEIKNSCNQLQRECRIIHRKSNTGKEKMLLLIGDALDCIDIYKNIKDRKLLYQTNVLFGYVSWQSIRNELSKLTGDTKYQSLIISDLESLLSKKGFDQFETMNLAISDSIYKENYYTFDHAIKKNDIQVKENDFYEYK